MEAAEDASLEAAIGWLVQTILVSLLTGKLEAWIRQAELADDIEKLKSEVERVETLISAVKGRAIGNKPLARSLARLKELLYDADDVVDELDYYRLQQQVEGVTCGGDPESMHAAEERSSGSVAEDIPSGSGGSLRSKLWKDFQVTKWDTGKAVEAKCIHCGAPPIKCGSSNGTSVLKNHLKSKGCIRKRGASDQPLTPSSSTCVDAIANATPVVSDYTASRKRRRSDEGTAQITTANTHTSWDKAELSSRIQKITSQLQDTRGEVSDFLKTLGPDSVASSNHCPSDQRLRTSSLVQRKMYGRFKEKEYIIKLMTEHKSGGLTVLPILGTAGVGKTALAQLVYNDPAVESQFDHKIWVWVSSNFDETRLSREMLDIVPQETHKGLCSFAKPQEVLKNHIKSGRVLVVLDDVWDEVNDCWWNQLLAPYKYENANGNVILVTTRKLSVAKRIGTAGPIQLGALEKNDFWQLFKACAFGDEYHKGHRSLTIIGQQIANRLKGNSLAAVTAGALLRDDCTVDHWSNILKNEDWKSLEFVGGIMPAFKLSYDQLPYHLQQCFSYCSIFPYNHEFLDYELVRIWISQGFVKCNQSSQRLEDLGQCYLTNLVNLGFFEQVKKEEPSVGSKTWYAMCGLVHDFARMVSRTEFAIIDGLQYNEMLPTVRHLSVLTDSAYNKYEDGNLTRNKVFEDNMRNTVTSVRKLRTVVLIGNYDPFFFQSFQDIFQKAQNLRLLQMSATSADFNAFMCSLKNPEHLRYLKCGFAKVAGVLPQVLSKFYHLQVLDVGLNSDPTIPNGMTNLVSLRHLVAKEEVHSSIGRIGQMTSLQELKDFSVQESRGFEITQLQSMNELVYLRVSQLKNVKSRVEAYGAKLRDKRHLEKLYLSWKWNDTLSQDESDDDVSSELLTPDGHGSSSSEPSLDMVDVDGVLEGLEPNLGIKHLYISGYNGTSPTWLASNITSLHTLHLEDCGKWEILPSLKRLPFLTKLKLRNMWKVTEVLVPSLEELVLINMPMLKRCACTSVWDLNSSLRTLKIKNCHALRVFSLFEKYHKFEIEKQSWLPGRRKFIIRNCPVLAILNPFPLSTTSHELYVSGVSTLPTMEGSSSQALTIGLSNDDFDYDGFSDELRTLDDKILAFHNLRSLELMRIRGCRNLTSIWFKGFSQLVSLQRLEILHCRELFSWHDMPTGHTHVDTTGTNWKAFPSLESVKISVCGITAEWLSLTLRHAPVLKELYLNDCRQITQLLIEEEEDGQSNLISYHAAIKDCLLLTELLIEEEEDGQSNLISAHAAATGNPDVALTGSAPVEDRLNFNSSLRNIFIADCPHLTFNVGKKGLSRFTSLEKLVTIRSPKMLWSLTLEDRNGDRVMLLPQSLRELEIRDDDSPETLQPCFIENHTCLKKLVVRDIPGLKSLQLHSCTALEDLRINTCKSLVTLEGLQSLGSLRYLDIYRCPCLRPCLERLSMQGPELCPRLPRLEKLFMPGISLLTTSFCKHLNSLQCLKLVWDNKTTRLTDEQKMALQLLTSLQELEFLQFEKLEDLPAELNKLLSLEKLRIRWCNGVSKLTGIVLLTSLQELELWYCEKLVDLPSGLHELPSLKKLQIEFCHGISRLPVKGLPRSLKILEINNCSQQLTEECRKLATRYLRVKINGTCIN